MTSQHLDSGVTRRGDRGECCRYQLDIVERVFIAPVMPASSFTATEKLDAGNLTVKLFKTEANFGRLFAMFPAYNALVKAQDEIAVLREKLANPVVLPAGYSARAGHPFHEGERNVMIPNKHGDWLSRFEVEHAIQIAGYLVKDVNQ